jgi:hypothetical protein
MGSLGSSGMIKLFLKGKFSTAAGLGFLNHSTKMEGWERQFDFIRCKFGMCFVTNYQSARLDLLTFATVVFHA